MFLHRKKKVDASQKGQKLLTADFVMLFFLALFSNCYLAVYYCFEQWLERVAVAPNWRGVLLGALFGMVMLTRPVASVLLLKRNKLPIVLTALFVNTGILCSYQFLDPAAPWFEWLLLCLRLLQGFFLALYSTCVVTLLVECIPPGQSARGFALFSLTTLLPYAMLPSLGELLLPIVGGEPRLFAWTSSLLIPCLVMTFLLSSKLRRPQVATGKGADFRKYVRDLLRSVTHSGLGFVFASLFTFSITTTTCIFFIKGLCSETGTDPGKFFFFYASTIIAVRTLGSTRLDVLPRYRVVPVVALGMGLALVLVAWGPVSLYIPATLLYGVCLSLLYPLQASVVYNRSTPETRTVNSNLMMLMFDSSAMFSPLLGGAVISLGFSYRAVITTAAFMAVSSGALFMADRIRLHVAEMRAKKEAREAARAAQASGAAGRENDASPKDR